MTMILGIDDTKFEVHWAFLFFQPQDIFLYVRVQNLENFKYTFLIYILITLSLGFCSKEKYMKHIRLLTTNICICMSYCICILVKLWSQRVMLLLDKRTYFLFVFVFSCICIFVFVFELNSGASMLCYCWIRK